MGEYADLEISLHRHDAESYLLEFRFIQPNSDADIRLGQGEQILTRINLEELQQIYYDPVNYGKRLSEYLFADPRARNAFEQARTSAQILDVPIRLRLLVGASAPELHGLRWETLLDPLDDSPLTTREDFLFSRYLSSSDCRPVKSRSKGDLRALVLIANPSDLADHKLAPVDEEGEFARARNGLGDIPVIQIMGEENDKRATLDNLIETLRHPENGAFDIVYLICHGAMVKDEPWLWLENEQGEVDRISGNELVTRLNELTQCPRLVILASCQSAGSSAGDALSALGPRLARSGIPAVIAMQGNISMETVAKFMPVFFNELNHDGQIDRAMAVGR
ncbi:MAG: CHAT domain-containing protein, partial [Chloroflexota bacterium]